MRVQYQILCAAILASFGGTASAGSLHGTWCSETGETLHLDAYGIGANEHTVCEATPPPDPADAFYAAAIACRNVYPGERNADGTYDVTEVPIPDGPTQIRAMLLANDQLAVLYDADREGQILTRCD